MSKTLIKLFISFIICLIIGIKFGNDIEEVFGITGALSFFILIVFIIISNNKFRKEINKIEEENPELIELTRIMKSKNFKTPEKTDKEALKPILKLALFGLILGIFIFVGDVYLDIDINIIIYGTLASTLLFLIINYIVGTINTKKFFNYIKNLISSKYGPSQLSTKLSSEIIYGEKTEVGNIRKRYVYSCKILKFKCILTDYYLEELHIDYSIKNNSRSYRYIPFKHVVEYRYNLKSLGLEDVSWAILENEKILEIIKELEKTKILEFSIENDYLQIEKETVLFGYAKEDVERNINDIELFFNKIVKIILERN